MLSKLKHIVLVGLLLLVQQRLFAQTLVVDAGGKGNFTTIQQAINSLPDSAATDRVILIKKGTYHEKVYLTKHHVVLQGEDEKLTIITQATARDAWLCNHPNDWGVATLNLSGNDITLKNLTILNTYGFDTKADSVINCPNSKTGEARKVVTPNGHQMALRSMATTRLKVINCTIRAKGGDTVSPWNVKAGLYYFKDCTMEGGVDFYCPRGWAYAEGCTFICHNKEAAIWHDGSADPSSKTVLKNCTFKGDDDFKLGRYHRDAQFYLIDCHFAKNMADKPINQVPAPNPVLWGHRVYYYGCHKDGGDYAWFKDNLSTAPGAPSAKLITVAWALDNKWNPIN
jgi:pectinesterase